MHRDKANKRILFMLERNKLFISAPNGALCKTTIMSVYYIR